MSPQPSKRAVEALARRRFESGYLNPHGLPWQEADARGFGLADELRAEAREALKDAMPLLYEQFEEEVRERLLSDEAQRVAGRAAFEDFDPTGDFDLLEEPLQMSWEGNTAAGIEAALDSTLPTLEEGEG